MSAILTAAQLAKKRAGALPYKTINRGSLYGFNNTLIESATQTQDRKSINLVDYDIHRTVSSIGRRTLMSLARTMFWRIPPLQAAILEQADLAVSPFTPRFLGKNKAWGEMAAERLNQFHEIMDLAGWPYDYDSHCSLTIISTLVDGDQATFLTQDRGGNARVQTIPSHRVGSRYQTGGTAQVRYESNTLSIDDVLIDDSLPYTFAQPLEWQATIIDGAILDDQSRAIAYRIYEDPAVSGTYRDISSRSCFLDYIPMFPGQVRGFSLLASSVFDWQDWREWKRFEMLAQKTFSSKTIVETNETGDIDSSKEIVKAGSFNTDGTRATLDIQMLDGGAYTYLKAGSNSKLEAFNWGNRPGAVSQDFMNLTVRDAMRGTEWDSFFSLDPQHVGGAPMRVIVDRINRVLKKRRRLVGKNMRRIDAYALAKDIKNGLIEFDPEWYKWTYQGPPDLTADRRYDAQTDQMEYELGWSTMDDIEKRRNGDWRAKRDQREVEVNDLYERAKRIADKFEISIQEAATQISMVGTVSLSRKEQEQEPTQPQETGTMPAKPGGNQP